MFGWGVREEEVREEEEGAGEGVRGFAAARERVSVKVSGNWDGMGRRHTRE